MPSLIGHILGDLPPAFGSCVLCVGDCPLFPQQQIGPVPKQGRCETEPHDDLKPKREWLRLAGMDFTVYRELSLSKDVTASCA